MECQATYNNDVLCSNGYYGFQPLLNGGGGGGGGGAGGVYHEETCVSNGHAAGGLEAEAASLAWQRKRGRDEEAVNGCGNGVAGPVNVTSAKASANRLSIYLSRQLPHRLFLHRERHVFRVRARKQHAIERFAWGIIIDNVIKYVM